MVTYIRFRINREIRTEFLKNYVTSIAILNKENHCADCRISECISEPENLILQLDWTDFNQNDVPAVVEFKRLIAAYSEYILEMRNYKDLSLSDI